jgi:pimeloyl-ACP methyl ester carboxylesterase
LDDAIAYVATETDSGDIRTHAERWTPEQLYIRTENMMRQRADGAWEWKYSQRAILEIMEQRRIGGEDPILENAGKVNCPVLLIRGANSKTCTLENARAIQNAFPNCRTVTVPDVSHGIHQEKLAEFMTAINEFLR